MLDATDEDERVALASVLGRGALTSVYQPIYDLDTMSVVAYEALVRGPRGSRVERPDALFAAARAHGMLAAVDAACQRTATDGALAAGMHPDHTLFVNIEPETLTSGSTPFDWFPAGAPGTPRLVAEVTERSITSRPAELIAMLARARSQGIAIAVDDVGADPASLALLPIIAPEVIKLDLTLVQSRPSVEIARIHSAISAESERSGATILAEGIETEAHLQQARALGASLGQGYLLGRPGPLPAPSTPSTVWRPTPHRAGAPASGTPFQLVVEHRRTAEASKATLIEMSKLLEESALRLDSPGICLSAFQYARNVTPATALRYQRLAARCSLVGVLAADLHGAPVPGVRTGSLEAADPLRGEWSVVVVGAHHAAALVALDLGDTGPERERRFCYALTHDRDLVLDAARNLMARLGAPG